jgi:Ca-activated chloride channel family protein
MSDHWPQDNSLDAELRSVPIPPGLMARLERLARYGDEQLDVAVREVPLPPGLLQRLERIDKHQRALAPVRVRRWAMAAAVFVAVGTSLWGSLLLFVRESYQVVDAKTAAPLNALILQVDPASEDVEIDLAMRFESGSLTGVRPSHLVIPQIDIPLLSAADLRPRDSNPPSSENENQRRSPSGVSVAASTESGRSFASSGIFGMEKFWRVSPGKRRDEALLMDVSLAGIEDLLADTRYDNLPDLHKVPGPIPRGVDPPRGDISDRLFLLQTGVFPFVDPQFQPASVTPLVSGVASFELWRGYLEDGELLPPSKVRTEEFLAAIDYSFPRPTNQALALRTSSSPSPWPWDEPGRGLLQIGVQARDLPAAVRPPMHLTIAVDISASMRRGGRLEMLRRALSTLAGKLGPRDRVSLVAFHERARVVVEDVGLAEKETLRKAVASLETEAATNLAAGLLVAYSTASTSRPVAGSNRRVVLVTDGLTQQDPDSVERLDKLLASGANAGLTLDCIDLSQEEELEPQLAALVQHGRGKLHRAMNSEQIGWAFQETLSGQSQVVAADARVTVTFNPRVVYRYRMLGHEPTPVAGLMPVRLEADFKSGQSAVAMYEFMLKPGKEAEIATVRLEWRDPRDGTPRQATQVITRAQMPSSFVDSSVTLQWGAVAAFTAEILRESPFRANLSEVVQLARQVRGQSRQPGSFHEFVSLVERSEKAKPQRGNPRSSRSR